MLMSIMAAKRKILKNNQGEVNEESCCNNSKKLIQ